MERRTMDLEWAQEQERGSRLLLRYYSFLDLQRSKISINIRYSGSVDFTCEGESFLLEYWMVWFSCLVNVDGVEPQSETTGV